MESKKPLCFYLKFTSSMSFKSVQMTNLLKRKFPALLLDTDKVLYKLFKIYILFLGSVAMLRLYIS